VNLICILNYKKFALIVFLKNGKKKQFYFPKVLKQETVEKLKKVKKILNEDIFFERIINRIENEKTKKSFYSQKIV
jgi:hypothetical protein